MLSGSSYESSNKVDYHCGGDDKKLSGEHKMDMNSKHSDISSRKTEVSMFLCNWELHFIT